MIHAHADKNGQLRRYSNSNEVLADNIYDKEFKLNVIHNANTHMIDIYINDVKKMSVKDNGNSKEKEGYWFKTGVYSLDDGSKTMVLKVRDITLWQK